MGGFRSGSVGVAAALCVLGVSAPALADDTVVVQGTAFLDPARANLSFVGCADLYQRADEQLVPTVGVGPGAAPSGTRSLGFDLGGGNAVGALLTVGSVLGTATASIDVNAVGRAEGVAYAGYRAPSDAGTALLWLGRSDLVTAGGAWQTVDAASRAYTWTQYDMATRQAVAAGPGVPMTVAAFAAGQGGDGPGLFTIGFGCDGTAFSMDRLRVGSRGEVTTYDVEGLRTQVTIAAEPARGVRQGDEVTITGELHTSTGGPVPHATMVLERRRAGSDDWEQVLVAPVTEKGVRARVVPKGRTAYRWRFVERPLAEGSASSALVIDVLPSLPADLPTDRPTDRPTGRATDEPSGEPSEPTSDGPVPSVASPGTAAPPQDAPSTPAPASTRATTAPSGSPSSPAATGGPAGDEDARPGGSDSLGTP